MSLLSSSSFLEDKKALIEIKDKENALIMSPIYTFAQMSHRKQIIDSRNIISTNYQQYNELSFRAKSLESELNEYKQAEIKLKRQLDTEKTLKRVIEAELGQVKEYLMRQQRLDQTNDTSLRRTIQELTESKKQIQQLQIQLNNQRIKNKIDSEKQKKKLQQFDQIKKQLLNYQLQFQESKQKQKQLYEKLSESDKNLIELKFQKNSLVQQLKMQKYQREVSFRENNKQKCEQFLSVTRQLNQMSLQCAKWRTQWQELRSKQQSVGEKQKSRFAVIQVQQQKIIDELRQRLEQKQKLETLSIEQTIRLNEQVRLIQQSQKVRKQEMIKKDRYVLKLEYQTKKFESQCQLRIKQIESQAEEKFKRLQYEHVITKQQNDQLKKQLSMQKQKILQIESENKLIDESLKQSNIKIEQLNELINFLKTEIDNTNQNLSQNKSVIECHLNSIKLLTNQIQHSSSQIISLHQSQKDLQTHYLNLIISIKVQLTQKHNIQRQSLLSQLSSQQQQLRSQQIESEYIKNTLIAYHQELETIKIDKENETKRHKFQKQKLKKILIQKDIMLRVTKSQSAGIQQIMNEEMDKRNQIIQQLVRQTKNKNF